MVETDWHTQRFFSWLVATLAALLVLTASSRASAGDAGEAGAAPARTQDVRALRVGVAGSAPFVMKGELELGGISVDIWRDVARNAGLEAQLIQVSSVAVGLEAVARGELDVLVGPSSRTAPFSQFRVRRRLRSRVGSGRASSTPRTSTTVRDAWRAARPTRSSSTVPSCSTT